MVTYQAKRHKVGLEYKDGKYHIYIDDKYRTSRSTLFDDLRALEDQFSIHKAGEYLREREKEWGLDDYDTLF